jgi:hypothetical protein
MPLPLTRAIAEAIASRAIQPDIADPDELEDALARFEPLVEALDQIRPGIREDGAALAAAFVLLRPPKPRPDRLTAADMAAEIEKVRQLLHGIDPGSWVAIFRQASKHGYSLPSSPDIMFRILGEAASGLLSMPHTRRGRGASGHAVASACASLYYGWTRKLPAIMNYHQFGVCNDYAALVKATFDTFELDSSWEKSAMFAARDLARVIKNTDKKAKDEL